MRITIDTDAGTMSLDADRAMDLYSTPAFEALSSLWLKLSWVQKYSYTFTWMGRPIIQHPEDLVRLQEVVYTLKPDVIIETGIAHGGSLVFFASLFKAMGHGRKVIGIDIDVREHNRRALEAHELRDTIEIVIGDSVAPEVVAKVGASLRPEDKVLVILDSNHSKAHVLAELRAYHRFVSPGSYIVATDGIMKMVYDTPRGIPSWQHDNPSAAALEFVAEHPDFRLQAPGWRFNESPLSKDITAWPEAWLLRAA